MMINSKKFRLKKGFRKFQRLEIRELLNLFIRKSHGSETITQTIQLTKKNINNLKSGSITTVNIILSCPMTSENQDHLLILKPPR